MTATLPFLQVYTKWVDIPALVPEGGSFEKARLKARKALQ